MNSQTGKYLVIPLPNIGGDIEKNLTKKMMDLSNDIAVLSMAIDLNINRSEAAEMGIVQAKQWETENQAAIQSSNDFVETHGLPLHVDRLF